MKKSPLLTIVIPNYNYARYIGDAIESVLAQSCNDYELIVVDGGSNDMSIDVIKKYADNIAWWVSEPDKGQSNAFNKGFSHARGRFLTWLNADDVMLPGTIEKLKRNAEQFPKCEWFVGGVIWLDDHLRVHSCHRSKAFSDIRARAGLVSAWGPSSFFATRLLNAVGGVDERFQYTMDTDLWLKFAMVQKAKYRICSDYAFGLRLHKDAKMSAHMFKESGQTNNPNHPKWRQLAQEREWRDAIYPQRKSTLLVRLLSLNLIRVLGEIKDTFLNRGRYYLDMFE